MQACWENIKMNQQVRLTIDVFKLGILFFRTEQREKENLKKKVDACIKGAGC